MYTIIIKILTNVIANTIYFRFLYISIPIFFKALDWIFKSEGGLQLSNHLIFFLTNNPIIHLLKNIWVDFQRMKIKKCN